MAIVRTVLPRKGLVQPQHGLEGYESDIDFNWAVLDGSVAFMTDLGNFACPGSNVEIDDYYCAVIGGPLILKAGIVYILGSPLGTGSALLSII